MLKEILNTILDFLKPIDKSIPDPVQIQLKKPPKRRKQKATSKRMRLILDRIWYTHASTVGKLFIDGNFECYILEDEDKLKNRRKKVYGETAIPRGVYEIRLTYSPRFKRKLPLLVAVPGFTGVRIHAGNTAKDTDGCLLPGTFRNENFVGASKRAFNKLYGKFERAKQDGKKITIDIDPA